jgi:hypothetical protein
LPTYEVEINGQTFEIEAPDDQSVNLAVRQLQGQQPAQPSSASQQLDNYYSSGIYSGQYNPLGPIARSLDAATTGVGDALTFGFGDELSGLWGGTDTQRQRQAALAESNPASMIAGQIAGGVTAGGALNAAGVLPTLGQGASLATRVGVGAGEGFGLGSLYGLGSGKDGKRTENALISGGIGAVGGAAVPLIAQGVSTGMRNIADNLARNEVARNAGVSPEVARQLAQTLDADATLGPAGRANMAAAGQEAMLADAGPNARAVLDTAIQRGGPGAVLARGRIDERVGRDAAALNTALDNTLGVPQGVTAARSAIREGTAGARQSAYDAAYSTPIDYASEVGQGLESLVRDRVPGSIISQANRLMQLEGNQSQQILARIADDGSFTFEQLPDVRQLDYITRALNQAAESGEGAGALGGQTTLGRAYQGLARDIRSSLREAVPEYGNALSVAADPIRRSQAVELGNRLLSPGLRRDQLAEAVDGYSAAERDALAQGVRSYIDDTIANVTRTVQDGNTDAREAYKAIRDLSSRANREKLTTALGAERAEPLFNELDRISQSFNLRGSVAENSKTFARQATNEMLRENAAPGALGTLGRGEGINATKRVIQALTGQTDEAIRGRENAIASEIADYLTRPASQAIPAFQAMQNYQGQTLANQVRANRVAELLMAPSLAVYPVSGQLADRLQR